MKFFFGKWIWIFVFVAGCGGASTGGTETGNPSDTVGLAMGNSVDAVSSVLSADTNALTSLILETDQEQITSDFAALRACDVDDGLSVSIACSEANHTASIVRDFGSGCEASSSVTVTGAFHNSWFNMGSSACLSSSGRPRIFKAVQGSGAKQIISTGTISSDVCDTPTTSATRTFSSGGSLQIKGCKLLEYSDYQTSSGTESVTESVTISHESRIRVRANGSTLYNHTISTSAPLLFQISKRSGRAAPLRTLSAGTVQVSHNLAGYTVTSSFSDLQYDYNTCRCHPISGRVNVTVTDNQTAQVLGTGSVVFTQTTTGTCDSVEATYQGTSVDLNLGSCRGF